MLKLRATSIFIFILAAPLATGAFAEAIDFKRDIAPILKNRCWGCHGEHEQESGLRLDRRGHMLRGGNSGIAAVVPGKPEKSYLIEAVKHSDAELQMPPDEEKIPAKEIALLEAWIKQGAIWPGQMKDVVAMKSDHWSFQPVVRPDLPASATKSKNPVDAFLLHSLAKHDLAFSKPADATSLIRRASIVLTGLAPTPAETTAFVRAYELDSDKAYVALVDRLMASPHFGERWAQHWLDVIRWAETNGSEANLYRKNAWIYRDYVVRSFNEDKPYNQFIREQIAGDSMGAGEATGFLVAGPHVPPATVGREPAAIRQARADRMNEILQTVGASVMGLTIGCARCHNHKFDPLTITDYYAMSAVFEDIEFGSRFPELAADHPRRIQGKAIRKKIEAQRKLLRAMGGWEENWGAFREFHFRTMAGKSFRIRFKTPNVAVDELEVFGPLKPDENVIHNSQNVVVTGFPEKGDGRSPLTRINDGQYGTMAWRTKLPKEEEARPWVRFDFEKFTPIYRLRLSSNREYFYDTDYLEKKPYLPNYQFDLQVLNDKGEWKTWVGTWFVNNKLNETHPKRKAILAELQRQIAALAEQGPRPSFIGRLIRPQVAHVLHRGSPENPRDEVAPAGPTILHGQLKLPSQSTGAKRRAEFADWISNPANPLTARVMVNRIWHHVFGRGIVTTTADFGAAGAPPTHPELLDWLAAEFVEPTTNNAQPWSTKAIIRQLVLSRAFRQSSQPNAGGIERDADSTLLWRYPPRRVEAEVIRDSILRASGLLDATIGGRSYRIHNVKKTYAQWEVVDNHGSETWRRMLYQERMRRVDDKLFTAFDFPDCGQVRAKRPVSTTPLQALNLMNSDFVIEQSNRIAERALKEVDGDRANAVDRCFELLLSRLPNEEEKQACFVVVRNGELSLVCRALINSNEFAFLP